MRPRLPLILGVALCLCGIVAWMDWATPPRGTGGTGRAVPDEGKPSTPPQGLSGRRPAPEAHLEPEDAATGHDAVDGHGDVGLARVAGTIEYKDGTSPQEFQFLLVRHGGTGPRDGWRIRGTAGSFAGPAVPIGVYEILEMEADGDPVDIEPRLITVTSTGLERLIATRGQTATLHIVAQDTGQPISGAVVLRNDAGWPIGPLEVTPKYFHPSLPVGDQVRLTSDSGGRVQLPRRTGSCTWLVGAPGHAWKRVTVAHAAGPAAQVGLERGGSVTLVVPDWHDVQRPILVATCGHRGERLVSIGASKLADRGGTIHLTGLPVGPIGLVVGRASDFSLDVIYGRTHVTVLPGRELVVKLPLEAPRDIREVELQGTIAVPAAWTDRNWAVLAYGAADSLATRHQMGRARLLSTRGARRISFAIPGLPEGEYDLRLEPIGWAHRLRVTVGMAPVRLVAPPPASVRSVVVSATTGEVLKAAKVEFVPGPGAVPGGRRRTAPFDHDRGEFVFTCPEGPVRIIAIAPGHLVTSVDSVARPSAATRRVLRVHPAAGVRIELRHQGKLVSARGLRFRLRSAKVARGEVSTSAVARFDHLAPGRWSIQLVEAPASYGAPQGVDVLLKVGDPKLVTLHLKVKNP